MEPIKLIVNSGKVIVKTIADYIINISGIKDNRTGTSAVNNGKIDWTLQHYSDTASNFTTINPVLFVGQLGVETNDLTTAPKFKIGDGVTAWNILPYASSGGGGGSLTLQQVLTNGNTTTLDIDSTGIINAKALHAKGTNGNGKLGLRHQASSPTATGQETVIFAGSDGEPRYKNDGNAIEQIASRTWTLAQGFITNVITALGYTPENASNKENTTLDTSTTKYPTNNLVKTNVDTKLTKNGDNITGDITNSGTGFFQIPSGTTAQRPVSPVDAMRRYNTTTLRDEFYANGAWRNHARLDGDTFTGAIAATNLAGTNTGDETGSTIISKLGFTPVTNARTLTINGTALDLSANRSWNVGTILGSASVTNGILYQDGNSNTATTNTNLTYNGTILQLGAIGTSPVYPRDFHIRRDTTNAVGHNIRNTNTAGNTNIVYESGTGSESVFFTKFNSAVGGNRAGTSIPNANLFAVQSGDAGQLGFLVNGNVLHNISGGTSTNGGSRLDSTGLRVGQISTMHTTNVNRFHVDGATGTSIVTIATTTTLDITNSTVLCNATSGAITVNLPTASSTTGRIYVIKKIDSSANAVTIDGSGAETIDGATTVSLSAQWNYRSIQSNGTSWFIIAQE
jgi:hypothetical protein